MLFSRKISNERRALRLSLFGTFLMTLAGLFCGIIFKSQAIMLDGFFSLLSMGMTGLTLYTARLLPKSDNEHFQFGYSHLEPLITVVNGIVILFICLYAFATGIGTILAGGSAFESPHVIYYALFSTLFSFTIYFVEVKIAKKNNSELVKIDSTEWLIDAVLSFVILIGFAISLYLDNLGYPIISRYTDPVLVTILSLFAAILPLKVLKKNIKQVLLITPNNETNQFIISQVEKICNEFELIEYTCHFIKVGRRYDLEINFLIEDTHLWTLEKQDLVREVVDRKIVSKLGETWLTITFTSKEKFL